MSLLYDTVRDEVFGDAPISVMQGAAGLVLQCKSFTAVPRSTAAVKNSESQQANKERDMFDSAS